MQVRERHFSGWDEIEIPVARNLEEVRLELRQVAGPDQRRRVHHERRLHLAVAVLGGVQVEHEVDERTLETRTRTAQHGEARAGDLRATLEVDDAECRPQIPVGLRLEVEGARFAHGADDRVVGRRLPHRHRLMRKVGEDEHRALALVLDRVELDAELLDLLRALAVAFLNRAGILTLPLGARDLVARGVLLALEPFELTDETATHTFERRDFVQSLVRVHSAVAETGSDSLQLFTEKCGIEHATSWTYCIEGRE